MQQLDGLASQLEHVLRQAAVLLTSRLEVVRNDSNPSTNLDGDIHHFLKSSLPKLLDVPVVSEEDYAGELLRSGSCWVVDPIDGTINAIAGTNDFAFSVSLVDAEALKPLIGAVYLPRDDRLYVATAGSASRCNGTSLMGGFSVVDGRQNVLRIASFGVPKDIASVAGRMSDSLHALLARGWITRQTGSAAIDICRVAAGSWTAFFEYGLMYWDFIAAALIALEAQCSVAAVPVGQSSVNVVPIQYDLVVAQTDDYLREIASAASVDLDRALALR